MADPKLKQALKDGEFVVAPGVFDLISALIADTIEFKALYVTGYGTVASYLGLPDAGIATYRDMVERARTIAQGTRTPLIADADTGFGGLLNVRETVRGYEAAGAMLYYDRPTRLAPQVEELIIGAVHDVLPGQFQRGEK